MKFSVSVSSMLIKVVYKISSTLQYKLTTKIAIKQVTIQ